MALHPVHGVTIRRFEPGRMIEIITENLAAMGLTYKVRWTAFGRKYQIGSKVHSMADLVELVDSWRVKRGLTPLSRDFGAKQKKRKKRAKQQ